MAYRNYTPGTTGFLVAKDGTGDFSTISAAIAAASSGTDIFIKPGTYHENPTISVNVNLTGYACDSQIPTVNITGTLTINSGITTSISNISVTSTSTGCIYVPSSTSSVTAYISNCQFTTSSVISNVNLQGTSSSGNVFYLNNCLINQHATSAAIYLSNSTAYFNYCYISNQYNGAIQFSTSTVNMTYCTSYAYIALQSTLSTINLQYCSFFNSNVGAGQYALSIPSIGSSVLTSYKCSYYCANNSGPAILLNNSTSGSSTFNSYGDYINTAYTSAIGTTGSGGTCTLNYVDLSTNATAPILSSATLTIVPQITSGGFYLGNQSGNTQTSCIGEQNRSYIASGSGPTLTTATSANVTNITLSPGIWDISAIGAFSGTITGTESVVSISTTSATLSTATGDATVSSPGVPTAASDLMLTIPTYRVNITSNTTYYLVVQQTFTLGTAIAYGRISANRAG